MDVLNSHIPASYMQLGGISQWTRKLSIVKIVNCEKVVFWCRTINEKPQRQVLSQFDEKQKD